MTDSDLRESEWQFRANRRGSHYFDRLMALLPQPCGRVLDAGCGAGRFTTRLARYAQSVIGLDLSGKMLTLAQRRCLSTDLHDIFWLRGDLHSLPFPSSAFDCVVSTYVLHLADLDRALPELRRVAKSGGRLLIQEVPLPVPGWRSDISAWWFAMAASMNALAVYGVAPAWQVAARKLQRLCRKSGAPSMSLKLALLRDACSRHLRGWQPVQAHDTLILWDKP